jgi:IS5 family transposase
VSRPHELEKQAPNRLDFQHFLGYPEQPPDYSTVWSFRERLAATRTDESWCGGSCRGSSTSGG